MLWILHFLGKAPSLPISHLPQLPQGQKGEGREERSERRRGELELEGGEKKGTGKAGSQHRAAAGVTSRALRHSDFAESPGASAGLHDGWTLNAAARLKLGSHSSISNKNPEVGMTHHKSTFHESHPGIIFSIICLLSARLLRRSKMCRVGAHPGQEARRPERSVRSADGP